MPAAFLFPVLMLFNSTANACKKDAADLFAELDRFQEAIALYDAVADYSLTSALTKYSVKEYWLRAGLCALGIPVRTGPLTIRLRSDPIL